MIHRASILIYCLCFPLLGCNPKPEPVLLGDASTNKDRGSESAKKTEEKHKDKKRKKSKKKNRKKKSNKKKAKDNIKLPDVPKGPVANVNGKPITREAFMEIYALQSQRRSGGLVTPFSQRVMREQITDRLIRHELLRLESEATNIDYDPKKLEEQEASMRLDPQKFKDSLKYLRETEASWHADNISKLREKTLIEANFELTVNKQEIENEYEKIRENLHDDKVRIRASHILVQVGPKRSPWADPPKADEATQETWEKEAKARIAKIYRKAKRPKTDFNELARELSDCTSAPRGGDMGVFNEDKMIDAFSEVAFKLRPGKISKPFKSELGYHIIKVFRRYPPGTLPLSAIRDELKSGIRDRKFYQAKQKLSEQLNDKYKVVNYMTPHIEELKEIIGR